MKLLVDVDGVVYDLVAEVLDRLNERLGTKFNHEHITEWDFFHPESNVFTEDEQLILREIFNEEGLTNQPRLMSGAKEKLEKLKADGHDIVWLTAPWKHSKTWCFDRIQWMEKEFGHISKNIVFAWNKEDIQGDILIDDNPEFIKKWEDKNFGKETLLYKQPWNIKVGEENNINFLDNWEDKILDDTIKGIGLFG